jgi:hypothetical protein
VLHLPNAWHKNQWTLEILLHEKITGFSSQRVSGTYSRLGLSRQIQIQTEMRQITIIIYSGHRNLTRTFAENSNSIETRHTVINICSGLSHPTGWAALPSEKISRFFSRANKPPEEINNHLFLMNMKGLRE